jgi:ADP-heptose:LPS heptosyltransferase
MIWQGATLLYAPRVLRILALQLKRIGDLVLTAPALAALRRAWPEAHIALGALGGAAELLGAFPSISAGIAFGRGRGWAPWQQVLTGNFDRVYDFTGTDRSALATVLASAQERVTFAWVKKSGVRQLVYNRFVESAVRERHTVDHYLDLVDALGSEAGAARLRIPESVALPQLPRPFAVIHPGTARPEKYWRAERWAAVIQHLRSAHGLPCVLTGGADSFEQTHLADIQRLAPGVTNLAGAISLLTLAALTRDARLVVSCDTGIVHLGAAFETPQIALYGPTNPFHWRPRHAGAVVLSAASPAAPLTLFEPRAKGAPMDLVSTELVIHATDSLLASSTLTP